MKLRVESRLTLSDYEKIVYANEPVEIAASSLKNVGLCFDFLKKFEKDKVIYGINTGFGPMAQYRVSDENKLQLQYNLIRSHASGMGAHVSREVVRGLMLDRLVTFLQAKSGVHPSLLELIATLLNEDITPVIYEHGGVGASGDLVQLSHLALVLIGEGNVIIDGNIVPTAKAFKKKNIKPLQLYIREGLALINGTSAMTAFALTNILHAERLLKWSVALSTGINELMGCYTDQFSEYLNDAKHHKGQSDVAATIRSLLAKSKLLKNREEHLYHSNATDAVFKEKVQEYYSLRCVPQILGPIADTIETAKLIALDELHSVSDNPVIDYKNQNIYHGGNFHGDYIGLEMDKLKIAITKLSVLTERQLNYLLNHKLNEKLPPFINSGVLGLNFGLQGMQYTATSTTAENKSLANPVYVHSIPNNNDNQDVVSMGFNAALLCNKVIKNSYQVMTVSLIAFAQAIDVLNKEKDVASSSKNIYRHVRKCSNTIKEDISRAAEMNQLFDELYYNFYTPY